MKRINTALIIIVAIIITFCLNSIQSYKIIFYIVFLAIIIISIYQDIKQLSISKTSGKIGGQIIDYEMQVRESELQDGKFSNFRIKVGVLIKDGEKKYFTIDKLLFEKPVIGSLIILRVKKNNIDEFEIMEDFSLKILWSKIVFKFIFLIYLIYFIFCCLPK